jgi:hypothetical protein
VDERLRDERGRDERLRDGRAPAGRASAAQQEAAPAKRAAPAPVERAAPATRRAGASNTNAPPQAAAQRYYVAGPRTAAVRRDSDAACTNVERAWEGAENVARRGDAPRAYDAYLRLLASCTTRDELEGTAQRAADVLPEPLLERLLREPVMASRELAPAAYVVQRQRMYNAHAARDTQAALTLSRTIRKQVLASADPTALEVSGWLEQSAREPKTAEALFRAALAVERNSEGAREGLVFALLAQDKVGQAATEAQRLDGVNAPAVRAEVVLAQAQEHLKHERFEAAVASLDDAKALGLHADDGVLQMRAWALKGAGRSAEALALFRSLAQGAPQDAKLQEGLVETLYALGEDDELERLSASGGIAGEKARAARARRLSDHGQRVAAARLVGEQVEGTGSAVTTTLGLRSKSGETGEGRLTEASARASGAMAVGAATRVEVDAEALRLSDGRDSVRGKELRARVRTEIGAMQVTGGAGASQAGNDTRPTFEARARLNTATGYVEAGITREPVRDSVRAYGGKGIMVTDAGGALVSRFVGRALDTQAYALASYALDAAGRYRLDGSIAAGSVTGENLAANGYYRMSVSATRQFEYPGYSWLSAGPYLSLQSYERDENRFDGAYGGYFSPKSDVNLGLLGNALTREGGSSLYKVSAKLGFVSRGLHYGNDSGAALETNAEAMWLLSPHLAVGAGLQLRTSPGYTDVAARFGVQIPLERRSKLYATDLPGMRAQ